MAQVVAPRNPFRRHGPEALDELAAGTMRHRADAQEGRAERELGADGQVLFREVEVDVEVVAGKSHRGFVAAGEGAEDVHVDERDLVAGLVVGVAAPVVAEDAAAGIEAFVTIEAEPQKIAAVIRALKRFSEIDELHSVSGKYDLVALIRASNAAELDAVLDRIGETTGITGTESAVILSTKLERR